MMVVVEDMNSKQNYKVLPLTLSIETLGGIATPLVLRGTTLPAKRSQVFSTAGDNQKSVEITLLFGESPIAKTNKKLGSFLLRGIPPAPRGVPQIMVTFEVSSNLKIIASAIEQNSQTKIDVEFDGGRANLTEDEIKKILQHCEESKSEDEKLLKAIEAKNRATSLILKAENRIRANQEKGISNAQDKEIERIVAALGLALENDNLQQIKQNVDQLEAKINPLNNFEGFGDLFEAFFKPKTATTKTSPKQRNTSSQQAPPQNTPLKTEEQITTSKMKVVQIGKIFGGGEFTIDPNLCFVLMPFSKDMQPIYDDHIKPIVNSAGLTCLRADEIVGTNTITFDIWEKINRARLLIADLTTKNPNVFYELGLAHAIGKDVIILTQSMEDVPFDLKSLRCIVYKFDPRGAQQLEEQLKATITNIIESA